MNGSSASCPMGSHRVHCLATGRVQTESGINGRYSRMFPELGALDVLEAPLAALGQPGGACDSMGQEAESDTAAGWPFFGQLIAHDITADRSLVTHGSAEVLANFRTAKLDLECLYGGGPTGSGYLYDNNDGASFLLGAGGMDLPRNSQGIAIIGDARNDSHFFMNRLHLGLMCAHNRIVARLKAAGHSPDLVFEHAREKLMWFCQWIIVNEYLPVLVGDALTTQLLSGEVALVSQDEAGIPLEFADAAFRYGHAQIRRAYQLVPGGPEVEIFPDLLGFKPVPEARHLDFGALFDRPDSAAAQKSMRISEKMQAPIIRLPVEITGTMPDQTYRSLAARDLCRGLSTALPSGEDAARALGVSPLSSEEIGAPVSDDGTPLFYYILREAAVLTDGNRLGPVGGRIVADVLISRIRRDAASYLSRDPKWHPSADDILHLGQGAGLIQLLELSQTQ